VRTREVRLLSFLSLVVEIALIHAGHYFIEPALLSGARMGHAIPSTWSPNLVAGVRLITQTM
jgi:hypothetical protein